MIRKFNNGSWHEAPSAAKVFRNGKVQNATVRKCWNGQWQVISATRKTKTWDSTWTQSYWGNGKWSQVRNLVDKAKDSSHRGKFLYQGRFNNPDIRWEGDAGIQKGMIGFNDGDIRNSLRGTKIESVRLYLHSSHWWYYSGGQAVIGLHNSSGWQGSFRCSQYDVKRQNYGNRNEGHWIDLPVWVGERFRDNSTKGFVTYVNDWNNPLFYGYFFGTQDGKKPKLQITYVI